MLKEYAVDPGVLASSFETCRYLLSQFGADKGRLISKFPGRWKKMAYDAAEQLPDGRKKERVFEYLSSLNSEFLTLVDSRRDYALPGQDWLPNALAAHRADSFQAIIADHDDPADQIIDAAVCDEHVPLFAVSREVVVRRKPQQLAEPARHFLRSARVVKFVDPYFDPAWPRWRRPLEAFLALIPDITRVRCEFHMPERDDPPSLAQLKGWLNQLPEIIPAGGVIHIVRWKERPQGERFHGRYVMTEKGGLRYDHGLDEAMGGDAETTDVSLLAKDVFDRRWAEFDLRADAYELVPPVLEVGADGTIEAITA